MYGREVTREADHSISDPKSQIQDEGSRDVDLEEPNKRVKRVKLRDLVAVMQSEEGSRTSSLLCPQERRNVDLENSSEEEISEITGTTNLKLYNKSIGIPMNDIFLDDDDAAVLRLGHTIHSQSSIVSDSQFEVEKRKDISRASIQSKGEVNIDSQTADLLRLGVDLNNPFFPYKKLDQMRVTDDSECGSTTGPIENSESMRRWNEMKQHGFVSTSKKIAPIPKPRGRQPKKKKAEETKNKSDTGNAELSNKCTKVAAPSGLLSGLNPGIIKHVRNSKQVNSIIEAMLQNEKLEKQELLHRSLEQSRCGSEGVNVRANEHKHVSAADLVDLSLNKSFGPALFEDKVQNSEAYIPDEFKNDKNNSSLYNSEFDDDVLTLKLSSGVISSEHVHNAAMVDFSVNQANSASISFRAAGVASQWLGLIQQDIKGRLAALRRSKKRVKNAIQIELPYLLSTDHAPDQENASMLPSSLPESPQKGILDMHLAQWKNLFGQMEKSLLEEGKHLEKWLRQVEELQSQCDKGLKFVSANGLSDLDSVDSSVWTTKESWERECAVRAAAASIYSTSNLIMTAR